MLQKNAQCYCSPTKWRRLLYWVMGFSWCFSSSEYYNPEHYVSQVSHEVSPGEGEAADWLLFWCLFPVSIIAVFASVEVSGKNPEGFPCLFLDTAHTIKNASGSSLQKKKRFFNSLKHLSLLTLWISAGWEQTGWCVCWRLHKALWKLASQPHHIQW